MFVLRTLAFWTQSYNSFDDKEEVDAGKCGQAVPHSTSVVTCSMMIMSAMPSQSLVIKHMSPLLHCGPKTSSTFFISQWFLQTLTNFYNIWHLVYRVFLQHSNYPPHLRTAATLGTLCAKYYKNWSTFVETTVTWKSLTNVLDHSVYASPLSKNVKG